MAAEKSNSATFPDPDTLPAAPLPPGMTASEWKKVEKLRKVEMELKDGNAYYRPVNMRAEMKKSIQSNLLRLERHEQAHQWLQGIAEEGQENYSPDDIPAYCKEDDIFGETERVSEAALREGKGEEEYDLLDALSLCEESMSESDYAESDRDLTASCPSLSESRPLSLSCDALSDSAASLDEIVVVRQKTPQRPAPLPPQKKKLRTVEAKLLLSDESAMVAPKMVDKERRRRNRESRIVDMQPPANYRMSVSYANFQEQVRLLLATSVASQQCRSSKVLEWQREQSCNRVSSKTHPSLLAYVFGEEVLQEMPKNENLNVDIVADRHFRGVKRKILNPLPRLPPLTDSQLPPKLFDAQQQLEAMERDLTGTKSYEEYMEKVKSIVSRDRTAVRLPVIKRWAGLRYRNLFLQFAANDATAIAEAESFFHLDDDTSILRKLFERFFVSDDGSKTHPDEWLLPMPEPSTEHVRNCTLLFVPGFMNGLLPGRALEHSFPLLEKDTGMKAFRADSHPLNSCAFNVSDVKRALQEGKGLDAEARHVDLCHPLGDTVLMGYSKGAPEVLHTLIDLSHECGWEKMNSSAAGEIADNDVGFFLFVWHPHTMDAKRLSFEKYQKVKIDSGTTAQCICTEMEGKCKPRSASSYCLYSIVDDIRTEVPMTVNVFDLIRRHNPGSGQLRFGYAPRRGVGSVGLNRIKSVVIWGGAVGGSYAADSMLLTLKVLPIDSNSFIERLLPLSCPLVASNKLAVERKAEADLIAGVQSLTTKECKAFMDRHIDRLESLNIPFFVVNGSTSVEEVPFFCESQKREIDAWDEMNDMQLTRDQASLCLPMATLLCTFRANHWDLVNPPFPPHLQRVSPALRHSLPKRAAQTAMVVLLMELGLVDTVAP